MQTIFTTPCKFIRTLVIALIIASLAAPVSARRDPAAGEDADLVRRSARPPHDAFTAPVPLGSVSSGHDRATLGATVGQTYWDLQQIGPMGRMIAFSQDTRALVHMVWTNRSTPTPSNRKIFYAGYDFTNDLFIDSTPFQPIDDDAAFAQIDLTNNNRAVPGGHIHRFGNAYFEPEFWWDFSDGLAFFSSTAVIPRGLQTFGGLPTQEVLWPKFKYVEGPVDTVLHVIAQADDPNPYNIRNFYYFRRKGADDNPGATWDNPPLIVGQGYLPSHDLAATDDGKVALVWTAPLSGAVPSPRWNNDVWCQTSTDYGVTWSTPTNVTDYAAAIPPYQDFRAYVDLSTVYDANGFLHIVWNARYWPPVAPFTARPLANRILHWTDATGTISTVHSSMWNQTLCNGGKWHLNSGRMSVAECNGYLYVLFVQFNDGNLSIPKLDDCSGGGYANGDLYVSVSGDNGATWDLDRNISNSYSPGCTAPNCTSENWPSMSERGNDVALSSGATDEVVLPGGTPTAYWLDLMYEEDRSPGSAPLGEGQWTDNNIHWLRLNCSGPIGSPILAGPPPFSTIPAANAYYGLDVTVKSADQAAAVNDSVFNYYVGPIWVPNGEERRLKFPLENIGNITLNYTYATIEDAGPHSGWLDANGFSGSIPAGVPNTDTGFVILNPGGAIDNLGTVTPLSGRLIVTSNDAFSPDTFEIRAFVADTNHVTRQDTVTTLCLGLAVDNRGSYGSGGFGYFGGISMDFANSGECDPDATVYLNDGSPVVGWLDAADTVMSWGLLGAPFLGPNSFVPGTSEASHLDGLNMVYGARFLSGDSTLALEKTFYAPQSPDSCRFIIECLKAYSLDGMGRTGFTLGEALDWDIPSDSGVRNGSAVDQLNRLIYQFGGEYHQDDTGAAAACQDSDLRAGGLAFLGISSNLNDSLGAGSPAGAYTSDNATFVYGNPYGFDPGELYGKMQADSWTAYNSADPDSQFTDLHTVMTFLNDYSLAPAETVVVYTALVTELDGGSTALVANVDAAHRWFCAHVATAWPDCSCCTERGDIDGSGIVNVADLTYLVAFLFQGGPDALCREHADVNSSGDTNVADLTYLIAFLFQGGTPPAGC